MNTKQANATSSEKPLALPEPDPDNITVLTRNLPNKPILPWSRYDSPWREEEPENQNDSEEPIDESQTGEEQVAVPVEQALANQDEEAEDTEPIQECAQEQEVADELEDSEDIEPTQECAQEQEVADELEDSEDIEPTQEWFEEEEVADDLKDLEITESTQEQEVTACAPRSETPDELRQLG